ncbi:hypothetical protein LguiB_012388 [Lonicera macranthoides]
MARRSYSHDEKEELLGTESKQEEVEKSRVGKSKIIPDDLILVQILSRLPIKSLVRFRCVCKLWLFWLSGRNFKFVNQGPPTPRLRLIAGITYQPHHMYAHSIKSITIPINNNHDDDSTAAVVEHLDKPKTPPTPNVNNHTSDDDYLLFRILGSCDGLMLVSLGMHILLWNPSTRESKKVLEFVDLEHQSLLFVSGFCCRCVSSSSTSTSDDDDYRKVIIGFKTSSDDKYSDFDEPKVYVTNFATTQQKPPPSCWKQVSFPYCIPLGAWDRGHLLNGFPGHLVKGLLHWIAAIPNYSQHSFKDQIVYFDAAMDHFRTLNIPRLKYRDNSPLILGIGELDGCLAMTCRDNASHNHLRFIDLWVMEEYGVEETWTILFRIPDFNGFTTLHDIEPLCITKDGEVLLILNKREIVAYNSEGQWQRPVLKETCFSTLALRHVHSLFSPQHAIKAKRR